MDDNSTSILVSVLFFILVIALLGAAMYPTKKTCKNMYKCKIKDVESEPKCHMVSRWSNENFKHVEKFGNRCVNTRR
jgi:hypothetical protein